MNCTQGEPKWPMQAKEGFALFYCKLNKVSKLVTKDANAFVEWLQALKTKQILDPKVYQWLEWSEH